LEIRQVVAETDAGGQTGDKKAPLPGHIFRSFKWKFQTKKPLKGGPMLYKERQEVTN
jgi:hypothetical protein